MYIAKKVVYHLIHLIMLEKKSLHFELLEQIFILDSNRTATNVGGQCRGQLNMLGGEHNYPLSNT